MTPYVEAWQLTKLGPVLFRIMTVRHFQVGLQLRAEKWQQIDAILSTTPLKLALTFLLISSYPEM